MAAAMTDHSNRSQRIRSECYLSSILEISQFQKIAEIPLQLLHRVKLRWGWGNSSAQCNQNNSCHKYILLFSLYSNSSHCLKMNIPYQHSA